MLLFAARRLVSERIVMILAVRDEPGSQSAERGLAALRIGALAVAECAELARNLGAEISGSACGPWSRRRVVIHSRCWRIWREPAMA
jgi:hypothetical protein